MTTHNVESVIEETVIGGKVIPELLRGGIDLGNRVSGSVMEW